MSVVRWQNTDMLYVCLTWIRILMIHMLHRWAEQLILMPFMVIYVTIKSSISLQTIMLSFTEISWCNHRQYQSGRFNMNSFTFSLERKCKNTGWNECSCLPCLQQRGSRSREPCSTPAWRGRRGDSACLRRGGWSARRQCGSHGKCSPMIQTLNFGLEAQAMNCLRKPQWTDSLRKWFMSALCLVASTE